MQIADALAYLHGQNPPVIHSDIKPANVMLTPERDICLIDFNVSLAFDQGMRTSISTSGGYSPPEQYHDFGSYSNYLNKMKDREQTPTRTMTEAMDTIVMDTAAPDTAAPDGEIMASDVQRDHSGMHRTESRIAGMTGRGVDERSDIYSLGATVYHLLTGIRPSLNFEGILPITEYDIELSEGFAFVINKMMALEPENRYQNGGELLYALEHIYELDSEYQTFRRRERNKKIVIAALYIVGIVLTAAGWMTMRRETVTAYIRTVERAGELISDKAYDQAGDEIQDALALIPGRVEAYEKEALRLYTMGDYEGVIRYGQDVINNPAYKIAGPEQKTSLGNLFYVVGNAYIEQEDYADAVSCISEAIDLNHKNSLYFRDYAIALAKTGNTEPAESALDTAISLNLGEDSIYMVQGEIAFAKGEDETAIERLVASVRTAESDDLHRRAVILCVQAYRRLGDPYLDDEIRLLKEARSTFSLEVSMHISEQLADAYARKAASAETFAAEYYPEALKIFTELYEQGYATRQMMENIAIVYQQMDRLSEAEDMLEQITEKYPEDYRAYKRLAFLEADKQQNKANEDRDYVQMKADFDRAAELYRSSGKEGDTEMQMLENMMADLTDGGWI